MQLIQRVHMVNPEAQESVPPIVSKFRNVLMGIGKLLMEHHIRLAIGANYVNPVVCAAGSLPFSLKEEVLKKFNKMVENEIIFPVVEHTEWLSRMLVVGKPNGDARFCLDPSVTVPTVEHLFGKIGKAKYFCSLDAASGFYPIPLSVQPSYLCTVAIPRSRYLFLRLPFALTSTS